MVVPLDDSRLWISMSCSAAPQRRLPGSRYVVSAHMGPTGQLDELLDRGALVFVAASVDPGHRMRRPRWNCP